MNALKVGAVGTFLLASFLGVRAFAQPVTESVNEDPNNTLFGHLGNDGGRCAATSTVNSFTFLQNKYPNIYDNKLTNGDPAGTRNTLAANMGIPPDEAAGTLDEDGTTADVTEGDNGDTAAEDDGSPMAWWRAKVNYINQQAPGTTVFKGQIAASYFNAAVDPSPNYEVNNTTFPGGTVTDTAPTYGFISSELNAGEDVEIAFQAYDPTAKNADGTMGAWIDHALTVTGISMTDNMDDGNYDEVGDTGTITYIDPNNPANPITGPLGVEQKTEGTETFQFLDFTWDNGNYGKAVTGAFPYLAFSESPIPEPTSIGILLVAAMGLSVRRRDRMIAVK
jgi:hypothetical protein